MSLGERLKKAREDAGLTLKKFADISKIQIKYLERLEGGEFEKLPAFVYIHGFLGKYAEILNLPLKELLQDYEKQAIDSKHERQTTLPSLSSPKIIITPKKITWGVIILVSMVVIGYLVYQLDFLIASPKLIVEYPSSDLTINRTTIEISGQSDPSAKLTINGQQVYVEKGGAFRQEINLSPGLNTLDIRAANRFGKSSEIIRRVIVK